MQSVSPKSQDPFAFVAAPDASIPSQYRAEGASPKWAVAIRQQYGSAAELAAAFSPMTQKYCSESLETAIKRDVPSLARVIKAYDQTAAESLILAHVSHAVLSLGADRDMSPSDCAALARAICLSPTIRVLNLSSVIGFFYLLQCGEISIPDYKMTTRAVLQAFRRWADIRISHERIVREHLELEADANASAAAGPPIPWPEYARRHNIPDPSPSAYALRRVREDQRRKRLAAFAGPDHAAVVILSEAMRFLGDLFTLLTSPRVPAKATLS